MMDDELERDVSGDAPDADEREPGTHVSVDAGEGSASSAAAADVAPDDALDADVSPEAEIAASLRNALKEMRANADAIERLPTGEQQVEAAEELARAAGELDEQIGAIARADGEHD